jgi:hypothetical protein
MEDSAWENIVEKREQNVQRHKVVKFHSILEDLKGC